MDPTKRSLAKNAYKQLEPGEVYEPYIPANEIISEFSPRAIITGIVMVLIFSIAATYSGLKVAQVFEAAIPISILAVGLSNLYRTRKNTILENVIIQSIGGASGLIVAGSIFTLPALYIMNVAPGTISMIVTMYVVSVLGAFLGLLFLIPLRRYFVAEQHGKLPFPEATAINEIYVTGESGGAQAKVLVVAACIGGAYDFLATSVRAWADTINFQFIPVMKHLAENVKATISINAVSLIVGLGYITGLRYSAIICAGGFFSTIVIVPLVYHFGQHIPALAIPPAPLANMHQFIPQMTDSEIFKLYAQRIGVGAMAGAGIIGILKAFPTIASAFSLGFKQIFRPKVHGESIMRTDKDLKMSTVLMGILLCMVAIGVFFFILLSQSPEIGSKTIPITLMGLLIVFVFAFLFTTVAALATAMTGNNPISGMTLVTLILGSTILVSIGLHGDFGKYAAIVMGAVVCTALSMSGGFVTDLKVGYWLGATPRSQQISKVIGTLFAALGVVVTVLLIHYAYGATDPATGNFISGFANSKTIPAPQANLFATILSGIFDNQPVTWLLYGIGLVLAIILWMMQIPPLAFAIGTYLPLEINTPLFIGGLISHFVMKSSKDHQISELRNQKGTLVASGFIAGGAIMGAIGAVIVLLKLNKYIDIGLIEKNDTLAQILSIAFFIGLCLFLYFYSVKDKKEKV